MRLVAPGLALALGALTGCERDPRPPAPPPALAPPLAREALSEPRVVATAHDRRLPIAAICYRDPTGYHAVCGGIGPLHIPYPPYPRARQSGHPAPPIASLEDWDRALTPAQHEYVARHCEGSEERPSSDLCGDNTPLVASFDDAPVRFAPRATPFAFAPGRPVATDWPSAETPWLALDRDGDGAITSGAELFGDHTDGGHYANGFAALATLDANGDGVLDARDRAFARLQLWRDHALTPLAAEIVRIELADRAEPRCDVRSNCEGERAPMTWQDATGAQHAGHIIDVYLPTRPTRARRSR